MRLSAAALIVPIVVVGACGGSPVRPASPPLPAPAPSSPPPAAITGQWSGTGSDSQGTTLVSWTIAEDGASVSGTVTTQAVDPADGSCNSCHRNKSGKVTGTRTGAALTLTMFFAAGANGDPTPACSATLTGTAATIAADQITGTYTGSDTCEGPFTDGKLTMARRQ